MAVNTVKLKQLSLGVVLVWAVWRFPTFVMSKRRAPGSPPPDRARAPKKHSLDSDEEDSGGEDIPDQQEHIEGQEDSTIAFEGDVS